MVVTLPTSTPLEDSLFLTLYARALDNRRPTGNPVGERSPFMGGGDGGGGDGGDSGGGSS